ncbi:amidohydrolase family protein [Temperatibacter marinus]|uniref:Amidohydrolase family protein n=1 Tax=Temperatibacter marinus TaxID=1456591 RepID=A0AA52EKW2_9PROT|nr:amidohydrolase family protein [Temperatibacter marinus]WND03881.1 amidohydrolase family protein [Temperatibacter marinus]
MIKNCTLYSLTLFLFISMPLMAADDKGADKIFWNGVIYTADDQQSSVTALAIKGDTILYAGSINKATTYAGPHTEMIDLKGKMILPGLHDAHVHPLLAVEKLTCTLPEGNIFTLQEIIDYIKKCLQSDGQQLPKSGSWITVGQFSGYGVDSPQFLGPYASLRDGLDQVSETHIVYLLGTDGHAYATNSYGFMHGATLHEKAIAVTAETLKTDLKAYQEYFARDAEGRPSGLIKDAGAYDLFFYKKESVNSLISRADDINHFFLSKGVTSAQDVWSTDREIAVFKPLAEKNELKVRLTLAYALREDLYVDQNNKIKTEAFIQDVLKVSRDLAPYSDFLKSMAVKIMVDGVIETPTQTAALKSPYKTVHWDQKGHTTYSHDTQNYGIIEFDEKSLIDTVKALDKAGITAHFHSLGDRAIDVTLTAIEAARARQLSTLPHNISHMQVMDPNDLGRLKDLGVFVTPTLSWLSPSPAYDVTVMPFLQRHNNVYEFKDLYNQNSDYMSKAYIFKSMQEHGATLSAGSDVPVEAVGLRPFSDIMYGLMRGDFITPSLEGANKQVDPQWMMMNKRERLSIRDLIDAHTINGAKALNHDHMTGSLEIGKKADFIIINHDIIKAAETLGKTPTLAYSREAYSICEAFKGPHCKTKVLVTYVDGKIVYQAD